jgi:cell wall-associated NlpC family hydrolase
MNMRAAVLEEAKAWEGTPYHHRARVKGTGVDCGFLLIEVYGRAGVIDSFDPGWYAHDWMLHRGEEKYLSFVLQWADEIEAIDAQPADLCVMRFGRTWSHGAILLDKDRIIHAFVKRGVVVNHRSEFAETPTRFFKPKRFSQAV